MSRRHFVIAILGAAAVLTLAASIIAASVSDLDQPAVRDPDHPGQVTTDSQLHAARLDAAKRIGVEPLEMHLTELRHAGWDGCLGVKRPDQACAELFVGGYVAVFSADGHDLRYHFGGAKFVGPVGPAEADDGSPVPPELKADFNAILAAYAKEDLALRSKVEPARITTLWIIPTVFPDACLGFQTAGASCDANGPRIRGAFVRLKLAMGDLPDDYSVGERGIVHHEPGAGRQILAPLPRDVRVQEEMRRDLGRRLGVTEYEVSVISFRRVTWPDGCLGLHRPGIACTQALVEGFLAVLAGPDQKAYGYHGSGEGFVAASFETDAQLAPPIYE